MTKQSSTTQGKEDQMAKSKNTGLGRGLDAIFADNSNAEENDRISMLRISEIEPNPDQPRKNFDQDALAQLAGSISVHGLIQPIVVRPSKSEGYYEIIAGERRWRAAKMAGLSEVPVIQMDIDDKKAAQIALIENIQREDLNAIEEAEAYSALIDEHDMTQEELAGQVGKSRSAIANSMRLLELPESVIALVKDSKLSAGHARALLGLKKEMQIEAAANAAVSKNLSVREVEKLVKNLNKAADNADNTDVSDSEAELHVKVDYIAELAGKMTSRLGRRVQIKDKGKAKKIEISYEDNEDLNSIIKLLCGDNIFD